ncbi:MAG: winged helix-turn-helix domain-containing protein [Pyrinomonadaceae bacterium]|nr:winged helix-turn-helix domain-containing protein [Pyrinomonadaceae bacterium]
MQGSIYKFDGYLLDSGNFRLQKDGEDVPLAPKAFEVLFVLVESGGELVTYTELMEKVWPGTFVEESNLRQTVLTLRRVVGKNAIETVPKRGYRFVPTVTTVPSSVEPELKVPTAMPASPPPAASNTDANNSKFLGFGVLAILLCGTIAVAVFTAGRQVDTEVINPTHVRSLVIAPFEFIGVDNAVASTSQKGLTDAIVSSVRRVRGLRVIEPNGNAADLVANPLNSAARLKADDVLTGRVRMEGDSIRVSYRLIDVSSGSAALDGTLFFQGPSQLDHERNASLRLAREIDKRMASLREDAAIPKGSIDEEIRRDYLMAKRIPRENDVNRWSEAKSLMLKVVERAPEWALGHAVLAEAIVLADGENGCTEAETSAAKALSIDPNTAEAHLIFGICHKLAFRWTEAETSLKKAVALNDQLDRAFLEYGLFLDIHRRFAEAETMLKRTLELEPFSPFYNVVMCQHYYYDKRWQEAMNYCERSRAIEPEYHLSGKWIFWTNVMSGRYDILRTFSFGEGPSDDPRAAALDSNNIDTYWQISLDDRFRRQPQRSSPIIIAAHYAMLGRKEEALKFLAEAIESNTDQMEFINPDPIFDPLRTDPRFAELMSRLGLNSGDFSREPTRASDVK